MAHSSAHHAVPPRDSLIEQVCGWISHNDTRVRAAMEAPGGWEGWAQVELYLWLKEKFHGIQPNGNHTLEREVGKVWPHSSANRVDFWFTWDGQDANTALGGHATQGSIPYWGVELKCHTSKEDEAKFRDRVEMDFTKCNQLPKITEGKHVALYAIAIGFKEDAEGFDKEKWPGTHEVVPLPLSATGLNRPIYVIWNKFSHP